MSRLLNIFVGWDPRPASQTGYRVASLSATAWGGRSVRVAPVVLDDLRLKFGFRRQWQWRGGRMWDVVSDAPMATEFAISRFMVPTLCGFKGWALFVDCDVMFRADPLGLLAFADPDKAVICVHHEQSVEDGSLKMDGQLQTAYARKNWSSVMLLNCGHPANQQLTTEFVAAQPGRDLHRFCWLNDDQIGELPPAWNAIPGVSPADVIDRAELLHYSLGMPCVAGYEDAPHADEWLSYAGGSGAARADKRPRPTLAADIDGGDDADENI